MPGFTESSITLNFPDNNYFRFSECNGFKVLSGFHFKEMDACWYDNNNNIYWLIELKDYSLASLNTDSIEKKSWEITKKALDCICMFLSSKHTYPFSTKLNSSFPFIPDNNTQFKLITVVHCENTQKPDIQLLNNKFKNKFKPYAELFGIQHYSVIEHSTAIKYIPLNIIQ